MLCSLVCVTWCLVGCTSLHADTQPPQSLRDAMRALVVEIAAYTRMQNPDFVVIPQNGDELLTIGDSALTPLTTDYVAAIDGLGREDLFYGYLEDNEPTPTEATNWMLGYLDRAETLGIEVLAIDYCWDPQRMDDAIRRSGARGFAPFAAPSRGLDVIPSYPATPVNENASDVATLSDVKNFLYLIDPGLFESKALFLDALAETSYDALVLDLEFDGELLASADVDVLKTKANGGRRLVLCYLSIGEAEDYRTYWNAGWQTNPPAWLLDENPDWEGNYPVTFWHPDWQDIVFAMMDTVLEAGFDGVYLDRVDVYEDFEN